MAERKLKADMCRDCPECAVIFDSEGIHGHVPDRNSKTCQSCERYKELAERKLKAEGLRSLQDRIETDGPDMNAAYPKV